MVVDPRKDSPGYCPSETGEVIGAGYLSVMTWPESPKVIKEMEGPGILQGLKQVSY